MFIELLIVAKTNSKPNNETYKQLKKEATGDFPMPSAVQIGG